MKLDPSRLAHLRAVADGYRSVGKTHSDRMIDANDRMRSIRDGIARKATGVYENPVGLRQFEKEKAEAEARIAELKSVSDRENSLNEAEREKASQAGELVRRCEEYLETSR